MAKEIGAEWLKCKMLGSPKPKLDLAIRILISTFSEDEIAKLKNYTIYKQSTLFTNNLYFSFLLYKVKCSNEGINRANHQNIYSSSLVVKALSSSSRHLVLTRQPS